MKNTLLSLLIAQVLLLTSTEVWTLATPSNIQHIPIQQEYVKHIKEENNTILKLKEHSNLDNNIAKLLFNESFYFTQAKLHITGTHNTKEYHYKKALKSCNLAIASNLTRTCNENINNTFQYDLTQTPDNNIILARYYRYRSIIYMLQEEYEKSRADYLIACKLDKNNEKLENAIYENFSNFHTWGFGQNLLEFFRKKLKIKTRSDVEAIKTFFVYETSIDIIEAYKKRAAYFLEKNDKKNAICDYIRMFFCSLYQAKQIDNIDTTYRKRLWILIFTNIALSYTWYFGALGPIVTTLGFGGYFIKYLQEKNKANEFIDNTWSRYIDFAKSCIKMGELQNAEKLIDIISIGVNLDGENRFQNEILTIKQSIENSKKEAINITNKANNTLKQRA